jgi:hypothetical protein
MAISRTSFRSLFVRCLPLATSSTKSSSSSVRRSIAAGSSSSRPASKSIQCGFLRAISEFDDTFTVGAGNPSGVPRPVVKQSTVAPLATIAVDDTPSLPGASSSARPGTRTCCP